MSRASIRSTMLAVVVTVPFMGLPLYAQTTASTIRYIDTHNHFVLEVNTSCDYTGPAANALFAMEEYGVRQFLFMPQPGLAPTCNYLDIANTVSQYPDEFAFLAGGWSLNPMIQRAVERGEVTSQARQQFEDTALDILNHGAVGFGEFAAEHFSMNEWHPYVSAPPNHDLFLLLADIAAEHDVPIDLHMEAIAFDMPLSQISQNSAAIHSVSNPLNLTENLSEFEALLSYNENARIVWAHAGWDNTGHRTVDRMTDLLSRHDNLYMQIRVVPQHIDLPNRPTTSTGDVDPDWLTLIQRFPDRFVLGLDSMLDTISAGHFQPHTDFLNGLSDDLARKVAYENAIRIYKLDTSHVEEWK